MSPPRLRLVRDPEPRLLRGCWTWAEEAAELERITREMEALMSESTEGVPTPGETWEVPTFTFLPSNIIARSVLSLGQGRDAEATVALDCTGRWNHGEPDHLALLLPPETAMELADNIRGAAIAALSDLRWRR